MTRSTKTIVTGVTIPESLQFLRGQLGHLVSNGYRVICATGEGASAKVNVESQGAEFVPVHMERDISPIKDLTALFKWITLIRESKTRIVSVGTPKAGMLGTVAATLLRVPNRVYLVRGLPLETATGLKRRILEVVERITCACATHVICISQSLMDQYRDLRLCRPEKMRILGKGSSNGVDTTYYSRSPEVMHEAERLRNSLGIAGGDIVIGYAGRLANDKGMKDFLRCWQNLSTRHGARLKAVMAGDMDSRDPIADSTLSALKQEEGITLLGQVSDLRPVYGAMDILLFPSYREGFGNVIIEAASMEVPSVAYAVTGCKDSVSDNVSGLLVPFRDEPALEVALETLIKDQQRRLNMGRSARLWAVTNFDRQEVWRRWLTFYEGLEAEPSKGSTSA